MADDNQNTDTVTIPGTGNGLDDGPAIAQACQFMDAGIAVEVDAVW